MRLHPSRTLLCVIDVQERLLAAMPTATVLVSRAMRLAQGALLLNVKRVLTEQYPKGLGSTPGMLAEKLPPALAKTTQASAFQLDLVSKVIFMAVLSFFV